jgi:hypothetical protein
MEATAAAGGLRLVKITDSCNAFPVLSLSDTLLLCPTSTAAKKDGQTQLFYYYLFPLNQTTSRQRRDYTPLSKVP